MRYILVDKIPVKWDNLMEWAEWLEIDENRFVKQDLLINGTKISTVFLGVDQGFEPEHPILFETMKFTKIGGLELIERYCTWDEAIKGHNDCVAECNQSINN